MCSNVNHETVVVRCEVRIAIYRTVLITTMNRNMHNGNYQVSIMTTIKLLNINLQFNQLLRKTESSKNLYNYKSKKNKYERQGI